MIASKHHWQRLAIASAVTLGAVLIGKTEAEAAAVLKGCAWRFGNREGQNLPATMDYNPQRRSIDVKGGKVTGVNRG